MKTPRIRNLSENPKLLAKLDTSERCPQCNRSFDKELHPEERPTIRGVPVCTDCYYSLILKREGDEEDHITVGRVRRG